MLSSKNILVFSTLVMISINNSKYLNNTVIDTIYNNNNIINSNLDEKEAIDYKWRTNWC